MIVPLSRTKIVSAFFTEEIRWLTIIVVFFSYCFKFDKIFSSVSVSTAERQSSNNKILGDLIIALAIETRCF